METAPTPYIDVLKLSQREHRRLVRDLETQTRKPSGRSRRVDKRHPYLTGQPIVCVFGHPGGSETACRVWPRTLSTGGIGFLHGGFVYTGTDARVLLPREHGAPAAVDGRVVHCRHVRRAIHEVGVQFREAVRIDDFLPEEDEPAAGGAAPSRVDLGRAMVVDSNEVDRDLLCLQLRELGIETDACDSRKTASDIAALRSLRLVICNETVGEYSGFEVVAAVRAAGYHGPVVMLAADAADPRLRKEAASWDCPHLLEKPCDVYWIKLMLQREAGPQAAARGRADPTLVSAMWHKPAVQPLVLRFLALLKQQLDVLDGHECWNDAELMRRFARQLRGTAGALGYPQLRAAADAVLNAVKSDRPDPELPALTDQLRTLCRSAIRFDPERYAQA